MGLAARVRVMEHYTWKHVARQYLELWAEQIERARHLRPREKASLDYGALFSHYADEAIFPRDILTPASSRWNERNITEFWSFNNARHLAEVRDLIQLCRMAPPRIADLLDQGYSRDCILWLAKKGICRLVSAETLPETPPLPQATMAD